jgi:hypothetical protein
MWDISKLHVSACSNSVQLVPLQPIIISILFHHYKELKECLSEVEHIEGSSVNHKQVSIEVATKKEHQPKGALDSYFVSREIS